MSGLIKILVVGFAVTIPSDGHFIAVSFRPVDLLRRRHADPVAKLLAPLERLHILVIFIRKFEVLWQETKDLLVRLALAKFLIDC